MKEESPRDAGLEINMNGEDFVLTRYNTTLYSFWGRVILRDYELEASNFNHVFIRTSNEDDEIVKGGYLFQDHPMFKKIAKFAFKNSFPVVANMIYVPECDIKSWESTQFSDLTHMDIVPENWIE